MPTPQEQFRYQIDKIVDTDGNSTLAILTWLTFTEHMCHNDQGYVSLVENTFRLFPHSWLITGFVTRVTRQVPQEEQELLTLSEHLISPPIIVGFVLPDL
jgi:hypothetical protein